MGSRFAAEKPLDVNNFPAPTDGLYVLGNEVELGQGQLSVPEFNLLGSTAEDRKRRWLALGFTPILEAVVVGFMIWALMEFPPKPVKMAENQVLYFHVATPAPVKQPPRLLEHPEQAHLTPTPVLPRMRREEIQKPVTEHLKVPEIAHPAMVLPQAPPKPAPTQTFAAAKVRHPVIKRHVATIHMGTFNRAADVHSQKQIASVHTGAFNPGSMAKSTVKKPSREVQTGGFGAANGVPNNPSADSHTQVAMLGSFNLPSGAGHGNGTDGARGVRGTVAGSGFGNAVGAASGGRADGAVSQSVHQSSFGSVVAGHKAAQTRAAQSAAFKPVVVLSEPKPVYPPEARRLHIQGQVVLRVLFEASGKLRILGVVHGLGHGMDGAAIRAAKGIRFKPAEHNGRAMTSTAMVHIIFQLAY